ncbi:hypothetical protein [Clostridium estertheticum]|uniref:hypothetical protein n=1 Tax=Clostridium estertheticum TaxID=238834 RepID=UPI001CF12C64|nr:hypothetical protein [Clostridium estertheticum]MCB2353134.1 hypothetical protein [Clostridium estertheticum]WAG41491.1 hypothetical protein LL065_01830 [Clostridium estertheticum]
MICNYCCDKIQLGQNTKSVSKYNIDFKNIIEKCIECRKYIRNEDYNVPKEIENGIGYQCFSHIYDGYIFFSNDIYNLQKKLVDFIASKEKKTFEDNYMIAECYNILGYRNKAYSYIDLCMKKFNVLEDKEDKIKVYLLYSSICIGTNRMDKDLYD